jgi:hypothetical protein
LDGWCFDDASKRAIIKLQEVEDEARALRHKIREQLIAKEMAQ